VFLVYDIKLRGGAEIFTACIITSKLDGDEWTASHSGHFNLKIIAPVIP